LKRSSNLSNSVTFKYSDWRNRSGRNLLRRVLDAQVAYERMRAARFMLVHLLAFVGVVVWILAISPGLLPQRARHFTFILWGSFLFLTISVVVEKYVLWCKLTRYLARKGGVSLHRLKNPAEARFTRKASPTNLYYSSDELPAANFNFV
jgi:hypothetical protein